MNIQCEGASLQVITEYKHFTDQSEASKGVAVLELYAQVSQKNLKHCL